LVNYLSEMICLSSFKMNLYCFFELPKIENAVHFWAAFLHLLIFDVTKERVKNKLLRFPYSAESIQLILIHLACIDSSE
jgi:hypothetical protein